LFVVVGLLFVGERECKRGKGGRSVTLCIVM
jgi:hypothetical protein